MSRVIWGFNKIKAFLRIINAPKRNIGVSTIKRLVEYATNRKISLFDAVDESGFAELCKQPQLNTLLNFYSFVKHLATTADNVGETIKCLLQAIDYENHLYQTADKPERKWENVVKFTSWLTKKALEENKSLNTLVQNIMLVSIISNNENETPLGINLSTIHAAKGLEYRYVYLIDCEEGILPHQESINQDSSGEAIAEERRLMYVAVTRSKKFLLMSRAPDGRLQGAESIFGSEVRASDYVIISPKRTFEEREHITPKPFLDLSNISLNFSICILTHCIRSL